MASLFPGAHLLSRLMFIFSLVAFVAAATPPQKGFACALVSGAGGLDVRTAKEEAVIVWKPAQRTEEFVRRAKFDAAKPFGFIVPTPSRPDLSEVDDAIFSHLAITARRIYRGVHKGTALTHDAAQPVEILEERTVSGLHATVIHANDAEALKTWLDREGFVTRPAFTAWADPYIKGNWVFTAFRYTPVVGETQLLSRAVCLTFATNKPVFPYREPDDTVSVEGRSLRIYLVSPYPMGSRLATQLILPIKDIDKPLSTLKPETSHKTAWLQIFVDLSTGRKGASDLYFYQVPPPTMEGQSEEIK